MNRYNVLLVEDDEIDKESIKRAFEEIGLLNPLTMAGDGLAAIDILQNKKISKPVLILLDINMPRMNGLDFLKWLRNSKEWRLVPVVVFTSSKLQEELLKAYNLNIVGFMTKPIEFSKFVECVKTIGIYWSMCEFPPESEKNHENTFNR